ncbi:hypothetical protein G3N18_11845 [Microbacterium sp. 2C]|uniref:hypothetical protein n=1 Tax=Microbacterium paulum TaxID=2707006 RepID=UPI0018C2942A|nr:hypothetical protein [Microbacterium paulum]MBG0718745.1 hypothetical protein [Microbacterium paulum]
MTQSQQALTSVSARTRVVFGLFLLVAIAALTVGSALQSSLSGEFPPYGATALEEARWAWGSALVPIGGALAFVWAVLVVVLRKRIGLRLVTAVGVAIGGVAVALFLAFTAWMAFLV